MAETEKSRRLTLRICIPDGVTDTLECDSVCFSIPDGIKGNGGGRIGIRPGHIASLIAVAPGRLEAFLNGNLQMQREIGSGFASVEGDIVTLLLG